MMSEMQTFKDIISKSIPQAMNCPCEWFAGYGEKIKEYKVDRGDGYFKGKFKDFMPVVASSGYNDDGDRTIELCYKAEQLGFSPIGVTDGGGSLGWSKDMLKKLRRTIIVGQNSYWLSRVKEINPNVTYGYIGGDFMYRVTKPQGYDANITIENTDTYATVVIGKLSTAIRDILKKQGYEFDDTVRHTPSTILYHEEWNFEVNKETAEELVHLAMNIKKPFRDQRKKPEDKPTGKVGVDVDAFDLIYGI